MANSHNGNDERGSGVGRRSYLKLLGGAVGMATITGSTVAQSAETDSVVNLGEQGLTDGDVIDDYLEEYFESGVEVRVPEGEYEYHGSGFGGNRSNAAVVGEGEVIITNEAGEYGETIEAESGVVEIRNFTLRGESGPDKTRFRLEAQSEGHVLIDNFNLPDGNVNPGDARGFYVPSGHAGVVEIQNCYVANFSNNGIYASSPGKGEGGRVIVENCFVHNNNISGIRIGGTDSVARNCLVLNDGSPPTIDEGGTVNMRGIRIDTAGDDVLIENCEVIHSYEGAGAPIELHDEAEGGSGTIRNTLIENNSGTDAIHEKGSSASGWSAENVSISGDGSLEYPSNFNGVCVGDDCPVPTGDDPQGEGSADGSDDSGSSDGSSDDSPDSSNDGATDSDSEDSSSGTDETDDSQTDDSQTDDSESEPDESSGSETTVGTDGTELVVLSENSNGVDYEFTTTGEITGLYERDQYSADTAAPADEVTENNDGTWTATGSTGGGSASGDAFHYDGAMESFSASGDVRQMTLIADGEEVTSDDLLAAEAPEDETGSDTEESSGSTSDDESSQDDSREKTIVFDGTTADTVAAYTFRVSGEVTRDSSISTAPDDNRFDNLEDYVVDDTVSGILGKGIDGYRYTGHIVEIEFDGAAAVTIDGQ
ncbi:right-handed parallel beta-helix repeat-containing protein [Halobellus captivus]|uniref:right-handed parallel beta-helix repeat-containing protein n=1 Tax=Halobellus captivus TaxID=2592614 RepID=UPI00119D8286|nr:right-handed parallel beta-helix repeat-containing protein [Halobellus captivus]